MDDAAKHIKYSFDSLGQAAQKTNPLGSVHVMGIDLWPLQHNTYNVVPILCGTFIGGKEQTEG